MSAGARLTEYVRRVRGWYWRQVRPGTGVGLGAFRVLTATATVPAMPIDQTLASPHVVIRRRRLPFAAHAAVASVAAVAGLLVVAAPTAAFDDLGSLIDGGVAAVEPIVEPLEPIVDPLVPVVAPLLPVIEPLQPVVEPLLPIVEPLEPVVEPLQPIVEPLLPIVEPLEPIVPLVPGLGGLVPVVERLDPVPGVDAAAGERAPTRATPADTFDGIDMTGAAFEALPFADPDRVNDMTAVDAGSVTTMLVELGEFFDAPMPLGGPQVDAGTGLAAALLIGLSMAVAPGWATSAFAGRLRPIGLTLAPPVPPG
jgi:hypothetical protein